MKHWKALLFVLLCVPAFANSVQVGTLTYAGSGRFNVEFTQGWLTRNFIAEQAVNGFSTWVQPQSQSFLVEGKLRNCPCFVGFNLWSPTGHNYLLTLPNGLGSRMILHESKNIMFGPFKPGDRRSINVTTVPEPGTLGLFGSGLGLLGFYVRRFKAVTG